MVKVLGWALLVACVGMLVGSALYFAGVDSVLTVGNGVQAVAWVLIGVVQGINSVYMVQGKPSPFSRYR